MAYDLLDGVKVVELALYAFAPASAAILADWGANVIKIVPPATVDPMMSTKIDGLPAKDVGVAFMWEQMNRGKRCIGLDVATEDGRAVLMDLLRDADVFITNLLPGARSRFRVDVKDVFEVNPGLVYARASGHGDRGPERESGGFDHTDFWSRTGIAHAASMAVGEFVPQAGPALGDLSSGAFLAGGIAAALFRRARTGRGGVVDVSLLSSGIWAFAPSVIASQLYDVDTIPRMGHAKLANPLVASYTTRDGRQIYMSGIRTDKHFAAFADIIGHRELIDDPRFVTNDARLANARDCVRALDAVFAERDLGDWIERLSRSPTSWSLVQTAAEAANDPQVTANGYVIAVHGDAGAYPVVASPAQFDEALPTAQRAPGHGEHTKAILTELGRSPDEIARLKSQGVTN